MANAPLAEVDVVVRAPLGPLRQDFQGARRETEAFDRATSKNTKAAGAAINNMTKGASAGLTVFTRSLRETAGAVATFQGPLGPISGRLSTFASMTTRAGLAVTVTGVAIVATTAIMAKAITVAGEFEQSQKRTEAVLKATGNASGLTGREIRELAADIDKATLASAIGVENAAQKLLTFRSISGETFKEALRLAEDLASAGFGDLEGAATAVGKALENPAEGLAALQRVGIRFSAGQRQIIKDMVEAGHAMEAQGVIIDALRKKIGGIGAAEGTGTLVGAWDDLGTAVEQFFKNLGEKSGLMAGMREFISDMAAGLDQVNKDIFGDPHAENILNEMKEIDALQKKIKGNESIHAVAGVGSPTRLKAQIADWKEEIAVHEKRIEQLRAEQSAQFDAMKAARDKGVQEQAGIAADAAADAAAVKKAAADKKAKEELERLTEARDNAIDKLEAERDVMARLTPQVLQHKMSLEDLNTEVEIATTLSSLKLDANSKEGREIANLIRQTKEFNVQLDYEAEARRTLIDIGNTLGTKLSNDINDRLKAEQDFVAASKRSTEQLGHETEALFMAGPAAARFLKYQELLNAAHEKFGLVLGPQVYASIEAETNAFMRLAATSDTVSAAQDRLVETYDFWADTASSAVEDLTLNFRSLEDVVLSVATAIAKAALQAQLLGTGPLSGIFGAGPGSGGSIGGLLNLFGIKKPGGVGIPEVSITPQLAGFHDQGGVAGLPGPKRWADASLFTDHFPAILKKGERVSGPMSGKSARMDVHLHLDGARGSAEIEEAASTATIRALQGARAMLQDYDLHVIPKRMRAANAKSASDPRVR